MMSMRDGRERRQEPKGDFGAFQPNARGGTRPLTVTLIGVHALGAFVYTAIGATFIGWETCDIPGADGGADVVAGFAFLPVLAVVVLVSLVCLGRAVFVYGKYRCWPISRYALAVPFFWALTVFVLKCPR